MGGRKGKSSKQRDGADTESSKSDLTSSIQRTESNVPDPARAGPNTRGQYEQRYGVDIDTPGQADRLQRLEQSNTLSQVQRWADEGIPIDAMGTPSKMQAYRQREGTPVPWDIEQRNEASKRRNTSAVQRDTRESPAGQTQVPDSVRDVVSEPGQSVDAALRKPVESEIGQSLEHARVHRSPAADAACNQLNARAFTVNNHVAVRSDQPDPGTPAGQHLMSHELTHVAQQTGGAISLLPDAGALEVDPDPQLEQEAEETAQRVMQGGELGIQRLSDTDVHVQRMTPGSNPLKGLVDSPIAKTIHRQKDNETVRLREGYKRHIRDRHITGITPDPKEKITSLFPVQRPKLAPILQPSNPMTENQVFDLIEECVKNGQRGSGNISWEYKYFPKKHGIYTMTVNVTQGEIINAAPRGGDSVLIRHDKTRRYRWANENTWYNSLGIVADNPFLPSSTTTTSGPQAGAPHGTSPHVQSPPSRAPASLPPQSGDGSSSSDDVEITGGKYARLGEFETLDHLEEALSKEVSDKMATDVREAVAENPQGDVSASPLKSGPSRLEGSQPKSRRRRTGTGQHQQPAQRPLQPNPRDTNSQQPAQRPHQPGQRSDANQHQQAAQIAPQQKPIGKPGLAAKRRRDMVRSWFIGGMAVVCAGGLWYYSQGYE